MIYVVGSPVFRYTQGVARVAHGIWERPAWSRQFQRTTSNFLSPTVVGFGFWESLFGAFRGQVYQSAISCLLFCSQPVCVLKGQHVFGFCKTAPILALLQYLGLRACCFVRKRATNPSNMVPFGYSWCLENYDCLVNVGPRIHNDRPGGNP